MFLVVFGGHGGGRGYHMVQAEALLKKSKREESAYEEHCFQQDRHFTGTLACSEVRNGCNTLNVAILCM